MRIGVTIDLVRDVSLGTEFQKLRSFGMNSCQLVCWDRSLLNRETADMVLREMKEKEVEITAFWCGWEGPRYWNFYEGQATLGLVPEAYRFARMEMLMEGVDFAAELGVKDLVTHAGYMPENPYDPRYPEVIACLRCIVQKCEKKEMYFDFETGQETPVTLLRAIQDIGCGNVGINLDPANLIMYGKANPVDALDVFGKYVRGVHGKDGLYPVNGRELGEEVPLGEGKVHFEKLIPRLRECGYDGDITIEREITGEEQIRDILRAKELLEGWICRS